MKENNMLVNWKLESDVNDYVKSSLKILVWKNCRIINEESAMSAYLKEAFKGAAKTQTKTNFGKPYFHIEKYKQDSLVTYRNWTRDEFP